MLVVCGRKQLGFKKNASGIYLKMMVNYVIVCTPVIIVSLSLTHYHYLGDNDNDVIKLKLSFASKKSSMLNGNLIVANCFLLPIIAPGFQETREFQAL